MVVNKKRTLLVLAFTAFIIGSFSAATSLAKSQIQKQELAERPKPIDAPEIDTSSLPSIQEIKEYLVKAIQPLPPMVKVESQKAPIKLNGSDQIPARANKDDFALQGTLISSIYYNSALADEESDCNSANSANISDSNGAVLMRVCRNTLKSCAMEGVCQIQRRNETRTFNYHGIKNGRMSFFELKNGDCIYGFGVQNACLDPFFTIAADMKFHRPGEVIFIPKLVGLDLPNRTKHNGFMIVRDMGDKIVGANRFDFFSGTFFWKDPENPFFRSGLSGSSGQLVYYKVTGTTAQVILKQRNYPKLP